MQNRSKKILKGAAIGAVAGGATGALVGYAVSGEVLCRYVPGFIDDAISNSGATPVIKHLGYHATLRFSQITEDMSKKLPDMLISDFYSHYGWGSPFKDAAFPVLVDVLNTSFITAKEITKTYVLQACIEALDAYTIIPKACALGAVFGATLGGVFGFMQAESKEIMVVEAEDIPDESDSHDNDDHKNTPLQSQSFFSQQSESPRHSTSALPLLESVAIDDASINAEDIRGHDIVTEAVSSSNPPVEANTTSAIMQSLGVNHSDLLTQVEDQRKTVTTPDVEGAQTEVVTEINNLSTTSESLEEDSQTQPSTSKTTGWCRRKRK